MSEAPLYAGVALGALLLGILWRRQVKSHRVLGGFVVAFLALPMVLHGGTLLLLGKGYWDARQFSQSSHLEDFQISEIRWAGFDGAVGYRLSMTLHHPEDLTPLIYSPRIAWIKGDQQGGALGWGLWSTPRLDGQVLRFLEPVLFQTLFANPSSDKPHNKWSSTTRAKPNGKTALIFHLLPSGIAFLPSENQICLDNDFPGQPICQPGQEPSEGCLDSRRRQASELSWGEEGTASVLWPAYGHHGMEARLDHLLAKTLAKNSELLTDTKAWRATLRQISPQGLMEAGYEICKPGPQSHNDFRICYCRG